MAEAVQKIRIAGTETAFDCGGDDTILRAGLRAGLGLPYECNVGSCGSCKVDLVSGEVESNWPDAPGLTPRDIRKGRILACQCRALSDVEISVRLDSSVAPRVVPRRQTATLLAKTAVTHDMIQFDFQAQGAADFNPGQYALLQLPSINAPRAYSMSNLPNAEGIWSFIIRRVPSGAATAMLFETLSPGDTISLDGPYGNAYLREDDTRDIVCIAGGSGLAPLVSILRGISARPQMENGVRFFYGARTGADVFDAGLLNCTRDLNGRYQQTIALSEGKGGEAGSFKSGFIHEHVQADLAGRMKDFTYYVAGPPPMTEAITRMLVIDNQVDIANVHYDRFF